MNAPGTGRTLGVVAAGGAIGACARHGATLLWPTPPSAFPWTTFVINVTGSALLGAVLVLLTERGAPHPLLRPFLGTGVIGGYTTFSTFAVDVQRLIERGQPLTALTYLLATVLVALLAVWVASSLTRAVVPHRETP